MSGMDVMQVLNTRFGCMLCHAQGSWMSTSRPMRRQNSIIHRIQCTRCPEQMVAKVSREADPHDGAMARSRREYDTLCALQRAFPQDEHYGTLVPLGYLESAGNGIVIMRSFRDGDLAHRLRLPDASGGQEACRSAGIWLRKLHESGESGMQTGVLGVADKLDYLASTYGAVINDDHKIRRAWELLVDEAADVEVLTVPTVRLHGDFKPENMLCDGMRYVGLDIHWRNVGAAVYDIASFVNHLRLAVHVRGRARTNRLRELAEAEFLVGYGASVPIRALRWAQLYFALCYLGGYRTRGRLAAIYAYLRIRLLVLNLARQAQRRAVA